jgi:hypothetical protein
MLDPRSSNLWPTKSLLLHRHLIRTSAAVEVPRNYLYSALSPASKIGVDDQTLQLPLERNPLRSRLRALLAQAELDLPPLDEPAKQVPPTQPPTEN